MALLTKALLTMAGHGAPRRAVAAAYRGGWADGRRSTLGSVLGSVLGNFPSSSFERSATARTPPPPCLLGLARLALGDVLHSGEAAVSLGAQRDARALKGAGPTASAKAADCCEPSNAQVDGIHWPLSPDAAKHEREARGTAPHTHPTRAALHPPHASRHRLYL
jgi:hypothetical protein